MVMRAGVLQQASSMNKEELKDNAKEWLDKGQKWLMGAGKKLAAAAKEAQSTIQTRIEDMEVFKHSQGAHSVLMYHGCCLSLSNFLVIWQSALQTYDAFLRLLTLVLVVGDLLYTV